MGAGRIVILPDIMQTMPESLQRNSVIESLRGRRSTCRGRLPIRLRRGVFPPARAKYEEFLKAAHTVNLAQGGAFRSIKAASAKATVGSAYGMAPLIRRRTVKRIELLQRVIMR